MEILIAQRDSLGMQGLTEIRVPLSVGRYTRASYKDKTMRSPQSRVSTLMLTWKGAVEAKVGAL